MELLVIRHAWAEDREVFASSGRPDAQRPLTAKGIRRMKKAVLGLRSLMPSIDLLVSSPLRRAVETARIIADAYRSLEVIERPELSPEAPPAELIDWLAGRQQSRVACIVGHEPDLSELLAVLLADESERPAKLKKGSVSLVQFDGPVHARKGKLIWYRSARKLGYRA